VCKARKLQWVGGIEGNLSSYNEERDNGSVLTAKFIGIVDLIFVLEGETLEFPSLGQRI
jgi:hypothetical protein